MSFGKNLVCCLVVPLVGLCLTAFSPAPEAITQASQSESLIPVMRSAVRVVPTANGRVTPQTPKSQTVTYFNLNVDLDGPGSVALSVGRTCTADCSVLVMQGTSVTLTAKPNDKMTFEGWAGGCTGTSTTCKVTMSKTVAVIAKYKDPATPTTPTNPNPPAVTEPSVSYGTLYYVRPDGGSADQCTGKADAAYPGSGTAKACAWKNLMVALPPNNVAPRIAGGDTLYIRKGEYMIGFGAPGADGCSSSYPWDCGPAVVPSGPDAAHPTRILGEGYSSGCSAAPQLWGNERALVFNMQGTDNAEVNCLEITDHSSCVDSHGHGTGKATAWTCKRDSYPFGAWAGTGLYATDSENVTLKNVNIHGLARAGVYAGRLKNWTVENVRVAGNGWVGWDGDIPGDDSNSGNLLFKKWVVEWNGCAETYPNKTYEGCWGQSTGGYGDGVGTGRTGGNWVIEDSIFRHNTSDGLDLLYHNGNGSITLNRVLSEGNAGNQIKTSGPSSVTNSVVIGNCGFFKGKSFTFGLDDCRAAGDTIAIGAVNVTDPLVIANSTIVSEGNVIILTSGPAGAKLTLRNNIMIGKPYFLYTDRPAGDTYTESPGFTIDEAYALKKNVHRASCSTPNTACTTNAVLTNEAFDSINPALATGSPALNSGQGVGGVVPAADFYGLPRPVGGAVDRGAVEKQ